MYLRNCWYAAGWSRDFAAGTLDKLSTLNEPIVVYLQTDDAPVALWRR